MELRCPTDAGLDPELLDEAWQIVIDGAGQGAYGGAVALVACQGAPVLHRATGWAVKEPQSIAMSEATIFDLASLTKVVATLPSILRLVEQNGIGLDQPVGGGVIGVRHRWS